MSNIVQEIIFPGAGLSTDDDERFIDLGSAPYRLNILVSEDGSSGVLTNMKGNTRTVDINDHLLTFSNTYVTVGSYYNKLTRKCYYWVFSQPYNPLTATDYIYDNRLLCYNEDLGTLDTIFIDTANWFGLDINYPMRDCTMLGDWLYFNPRVSEPKMIDVVRAYNYTNYAAYDSTHTYVLGDTVTYYGGLFRARTAILALDLPTTAKYLSGGSYIYKWERIGDSYKTETDLDFTSEFEYAFNVIKMPPYERPRLTYGSDTAVNANNVRGKIFRFSYRYKYFDNSYSVYSAYSDISLPEYNEVYNGEIADGTTDNNYINIVVYPHSPALVKEIEVVFQEISGDWKRAKIINRIEQSFITTFDTSIKFYNNESYVPVDNAQVARVMDFVPKTANSQEIINKNILAYGGCREGFDNLDKDEIRVGLTPILEHISTETIPGTTHKNVMSGGTLITNVSGSGSVGKQIDLHSWYPGAVVDTDVLIVTIDGTTSYHTFVGKMATDDIFIDDIKDFLLSAYPKYSSERPIGSNYITMWSSVGSPIRANITRFLFCTVSTTRTELIKKKGFKTGANHPFCIFYYDENLRRWDAQTSKENIHIFGLEMHGTTVYVPTFNEYSPGIGDTAHRWIIDWEVYHLPPEGAKYWRWGYAGNSLCEKMVQYIVSSIATDGSMCEIDITPLQTLTTTTTATWNQFPNSSILPYAWQEGDRIRFITHASVPAGGTTLGTLVEDVYDYEIIKQDDTTTNNTIYTQYFDWAGAGLGENTLIEIYSPLKSLTDTKVIYHEFGDIMPIVEDSAGIMVHTGQGGLHNQDTLLSHSAMGTFDGGDIYHIMRTPSKPLDTATPTKRVFHESMWYSDFYDSTDYDRGKIGVETTFGERFLNIVRYSRPYFQNTLINGLPTFEEDPSNHWDGFKELNDVFGDIVAIYEQGDTLKVYQERKASSILIGRTEYYDTQGNNAVALSTVVLGAIRYSPSNYSTVFPESIVRNNKFVYGFDIYNGVAWRDGVNGIFPISGRYAEAGGDVDYKMQTYFKLKAKALMESGIDHVDVIGVWDEEYKNFYLTFKDYVLEANDETIVFHEPSNRWITFASFDQTPVDGYNMPLRLTYDIVKGFEAGIGWSFEEATGFDIFNIGDGSGTPSNVDVPINTSPLLLTINTPTVSATCSLAPSSLGLVLTVNKPTVMVSSIDASSKSMSWIATEYGLAEEHLTTFTLVGSTVATFISKPSWITVVDSPYVHGALSIGYTLATGDTIGIYPTVANTGGTRGGSVVWTDEYGNSVSIAVSQDASILTPAITVEAGSPLFPVYDTSGIATSGDATIQFTFTPNNVLYGYLEKFDTVYYVYRNSIFDSWGTLTNVRDEVSNTRSAEMASVAVGGESIIVYIGEIV